MEVVVSGRYLKAIIPISLNCLYTDTEQICKILATVPIGITASKRKIPCIFIKMQYSCNLNFKG
jgi:hypothetical protein